MRARVRACRQPFGASPRLLGSFLKTFFAMLKYLKLFDVSLYPPKAKNVNVPMVVSGFLRVRHTYRTVRKPNTGPRRACGKPLGVSRRPPWKLSYYIFRSVKLSSILDVTLYHPKDKNVDSVSVFLRFLKDP